LERKTVVRRAALIGLAVLVTAGVAGAISFRVERRAQSEARSARQQWIARLATEDQALLDGMAQKITGLPVDPKVIAEVQAAHYRQRPERWLYVWATANDGRFLFGVPSDAFARLNTVYDQSQQVIAQDNHYATRDQFLRALLHEDRRIAPVKPGSPEGGAGSPQAAHDDEWWRRYNEERDRRFEGNVLFLSSPIQGATGGIEGNLNLKAVELSRGPVEAEQSLDFWRNVQNLSGMLAVPSILWLAFLVPSWVYIDAQERRLPRPLLWALLTVVGNVVGLLVYLISRPDDVTDLRCPQCGKKLNGTKAGCPYCGADLSAVFCPKCQYPLKPDWSFCPDCRGPLAKGGAAPAEPETGTTP
jgi:double zinc ribbon protein